MTEGPSRAPDIAEITMNAAVGSRLRATLVDLVAEHGSADNPDFLRKAPGLGHLLPVEVRERLLDTRYLDAHAAVVIRGCPIGDLGPTPRSWMDRPPTATLVPDMWLTLVVSQMGDPMAWSNLQDGRLLNDIIPQQGEEQEQTSYGSVAELEFHVEEAYHDDRAHAFGLLCLRNPSGVATTLASVASLNLRPADVDVLFQPRFRIGDERDYRVRSVLFGDPAAPYLRLDPPYTHALPGDHVAAAALAVLIERLSHCLVDIVLSPGDLVVVDNFRAVHGRRSFHARYDSTDRWLRRVSVVRDLRRLRAQRAGVDNRVVVPIPNETPLPLM